MFGKSIFAGVLISMGIVVNLSCDNRLAEAVLFSFGLTFILLMKLNLYTGKIGYLSTNKDLRDLTVILLGNVLGVILSSILFCLLLSPDILSDMVNVAVSKMDMDYVKLYLRSIPCGVLMYLGVESFRRTNNPCTRCSV